MLRKALEYETLREGIVGLPEMPETNVHLSGVARLKTWIRSIILK